MKRLLLIYILLLSASLIIFAQVNQVWWSKGRVLHVNPIAGIDSVTYGQFIDADTFLIVIDRASRRIVYDTVDVHVPDMVYHDTIHTTHTIYLKPGRRIGVFSVAKDRQVSFSQGNLQYVRNQDVWKFADHQYEYIGAGNVRDGQLANKIDLFGWSANNSTAPFGISTSTNAADYAGDFVDWGVNEINNEAPNSWRTLSNTEWEYLMNGRDGAAQLYGAVCVNRINGVMFLPDDWVCPEGVSFASGMAPGRGSEYYVTKNNYTLEQWSVLEDAGAVFLPAAGRREGVNPININEFGNYWTSTMKDAKHSHYLAYYSDLGYVNGYEETYKGRSVRLVHDTIVPVEPEYVDLGLSVMWAICNVGASSPEEYGDHFAWGETEPKAEYKWETYKWCNGTDSSITKYCSNSKYGDNGFVDNKTELELEDDVAHVNWGGEWRMATKKEFQELIDNCCWETATYNGVNGYKITSTIPGYTDRSIFLPRAGFYNDDLGNNSKGAACRYWTSNGTSSSATNLWEGKLTGNTRRCGFSVRPVLPTERAIQSYKPTPSKRIGVFSVGKNKQVSFSQGNLIYLKIKDQWQFADNQWDYTGERHLRNGQIADTVMYFGWSAKDSKAPWGISLSTKLDYYKGEFFDWGINIIQGDAPNTWRTMSNDELMYLFTERKNADQLLGRGKVGDINGIVLLPDEWVMPEGLQFMPIADNVINNYTVEQWAKMESAGAVFIPAAGYFNNQLEPKMRFVNEDNYVASSILKDSTWQIYSVFASDNISYSTTGTSPSNLHYAFPRRLVHDTIVPFEPEYVDLGLSVKWATCNVGASAPEEYGDYFAWGEVVPKTTYNWSTYKYCKGSSSTLTKYCNNSSYGNNGFTDNKTVLDLEDDAATVNWGGEWRMPTDAEMTELREKCTWTWTTQNGVKGYKVVGPNGNSIFLPAAGYMRNSDLTDAGSYGYDWSSSLRSDNPSFAYGVYFNSDIVYWHYNKRYYGRSVRPVMPTDREPLPPPAPCEKFKVNGVEFNMMCVEGGTFCMGKGKDEHQVTLSDYYIGETEVTQGLWKAVMAVDKLKGQNVYGDDYPVSNISLSECEIFIQRLSQITGRHFRIPTEAEWEYAARGGQKSKGFTYSGSDNLAEVAIYRDILPKDDNGQLIHKQELVKSRKSNELGIYEMSGNLCEWVSDWAGPYNTYPQLNPTGVAFPQNSKYKYMVRGGCWNSNAMYCTPYCRQSFYGAANGVGFRLAMSDEEPFRAVYVNDTTRFYLRLVEGEKYDYYIGQTEVTQGLWEKVMGYNNSIVVGDDLPVEKVSWDECQQFIGRLNEMTGLHFRLPTEAEWEYAARGGNRSRGCSYAGSNNIDSVGWYSGNSEQTTHAVASLMPNELGVYDMTGNVWEWCQDRYGEYLDGDNNRVIRGGSWYNGAHHEILTYRHYHSQESKSHLIGLRLVMDVHEYVDLGLSVMWATTNVGATAPEDYGDYFAWGEVEPKETYSWSTYKWCDGTEQNMTKYNTSDGLTTLLPEDDVAHVNWGGEWRMPTKAELYELCDRCSWEWTVRNGVNGYKVTGPNGNSIFLPAAGAYNTFDNQLNSVGTIGWLFSSDRVTELSVREIGFLTSGPYKSTCSRCLGLTIRPVLPNH